MENLDYHALSWTILDYHGLSWTIRDYQRLSETIRDYHGLSETIMVVSGETNNSKNSGNKEYINFFGKSLSKWTLFVRKNAEIFVF